jgi:hypothetical protein
MINIPTVLILGAGASMEYGFPSGQDLFIKIRHALKESRESKLRSALINLGFRPSEIRKFHSYLVYVDPSSFDDFLEIRPDFLQIAKLSIAAFLGALESDENIFDPDPPKIRPARWYQHLMNAMYKADLKEFENNKLSMITFNYDRSLEHYLFSTLKARTERSDLECREALRKMPIIHVHGSLGALPWQGENRSRVFAPAALPDQIRLASEQIKFMSEEGEDAPIFQKAFKLLAQGEKIYFLGFGYHDTNLEHLKIKELSSSKNMVGTSVGLSKARMGSLHKEWGITFKRPNTHIMELISDLDPLS